jgi:hypothetical protein
VLFQHYPLYWLYLVAYRLRVDMLHLSF